MSWKGELAQERSILGTNNLSGWSVLQQRFEPVTFRARVEHFKANEICSPLRTCIHVLQFIYFLADQWVP
jgi:hypothetical protein